MHYRKERYFIFGSLRMARLSKIKGWNPGALITENHDYNVYSKYYKENLLNYDSKIVEFSEDFEWGSDKYFIMFFPCRNPFITQCGWDEQGLFLLIYEKYLK